MPKTLEEAKELDRRYKGTERDYGKMINVRYFENKHSSVPALLDCEHKQLVVGNTVVIEFRH